MNNMAIPVISYHSIGIPKKNWQWNELTCPFEIFETHLKWMKKKGFTTISLQQLYDYMKGKVKLIKNAVVITFDDGYLDNWVFAYPLLKKYGFRGAIYITPEFVDSRKIIRKNLDDVYNGNVKINELETIGYLSWNEIKKMEQDNILDVQSHTMSHTWYPISNKIIDFRHPNDEYIWMTWNENLDKKPFLQIDDEKLVSFGKPVYENDRAIGIRRFYSDEKFDKFMIQYVTERGSKNFFQSNKWRDTLFEVARKYREENRLNERYEMEKEYEERICYELQKSKEIIEEKLNKEVKFVCWPGGAVTKKALQKASEIGYISSPAGKDMINLIEYLNNRYGMDPSRINRITPAFSKGKMKGVRCNIEYQNGLLFILMLYYFQGKKPRALCSRVILTGMSHFYKIIGSINICKHL
jgi:hypothetical protein